MTSPTRLKLHWQYTVVETTFAPISLQYQTVQCSLMDCTHQAEGVALNKPNQLQTMRLKFY